MQLDDLPVGGGEGAAQLDEFAAGAGPAAADHSGPLEQRLVSKNWQIRAKAFEELTTVFKTEGSQDAFRDHCGNWKKYLADSNPGALEKCLDALNAFIDGCEPKMLASFQADLIRALTEKCLCHVKQSIKTKSLECFALLFEVSEAFDEALEVMTELLATKNQKVVPSFINL